MPEQQAKEILGWTADGRYFAYELIRNIQEPDVMEDPVGTAVLAAIVDTHTDTQEFYLLSLEMEGPLNFEDEGAAEWRQLPDKEAFDAWRSKHPIKKPEHQVECGDARLSLNEQDLEGYPGKRPPLSGVDRFLISGATNLQVGVETQGKLWPHVELNRWVELQFAWSPTCQFIAYLLGDYEPPGASVGILNPQNPVLVKPVGPGIHIMAHKSAEDTVEPVFQALESGGFVPHVGPAAIKDRARTVVYSRTAAREAAKRVAALVPGGATVEVLTWQSPADIVVAIGTSARP